MQDVRSRAAGTENGLESVIVVGGGVSLVENEARKIRQELARKWLEVLQFYLVGRLFHHDYQI